MNESCTTDLETPQWSTRITSSVTRCHLLGSLMAVTLLACIAWVGSRGSADTPTIQYGDTLVDLADAVALIDNADRWRQLYTLNYRQSQAIDRHTESIAGWLPASVDWPSVDSDLHSLSQSAGLELLSIQQGDRYVGARVGVLAARCEVQGTYASLCRFLSGLSQRQLPIACNQVELQRVGQIAGGNDEDPQSLCRATVSLRIPYAADKTAASRLLTWEAKHDS